MKVTNRGFIVIGCMLTAFLLLMICSRSSFLYPCNDWNDANCYFTMGKAMINGQVPYRDLYEQKGPYLFLLYGIAYLISNDTFAGVFVLEVISFTFFLYFCYKILNMYCRKITSFLMLPVLGSVILSSKSFYWGGAAEEFCLPLFGISLYCSIKYFKEQYPYLPSMKMIFLNGIFAGIIMQVKYTMLGFHFGWMAMMVFACLCRRDFSGCIKRCISFLTGMLLTVLPWLIYFGINEALDDWYLCYIYNNIFLYSNFNNSKIDIFDRIYSLAKVFYGLIIENFPCFFFIILGMGTFILSSKNHWYEKVNLLFLFGFLFIGTYAGGLRLPYYSIPLTVFSILGFAIAGKSSEIISDRLTPKLSVGTQKPLNILSLFSVIMIISTVSAYALSMNCFFMKQEKSSFFLYKFKEIVQQEESPTLLNISCLDAGLYTVADIMPTCKYFQTTSIAPDNLFEEYSEQQRYIEEGKTQFILARDYYPEIIWKNYTLVSKLPYQQDSQKFTYFLFKRIDLPSE